MHSGSTFELTHSYLSFTQCSISDAWVHMIMHTCNYKAYACISMCICWSTLLTALGSGNSLANNSSYGYYHTHTGTGKGTREFAESSRQKKLGGHTKLAPDYQSGGQDSGKGNSYPTP